MSISKTTGGRALQERQRNRKLPAFEIPQGTEPQLVRALESIAEHLRMYEGDRAAPKERFVTLAELENAGIVKSDVKSGFGFISEALGKEVAQKAGSTANPTQTEPVKNDTSRTGRIPSGGGSGGGYRKASVAGSTSTTAKFGDANDVTISSPAQNDFVIYDGGIWKNYSLFKKQNLWRARQTLGAPLAAQYQASTPEVIPQTGLIYTKSDGDLYYLDDAGNETNLTTAGASQLTDLTDVVDTFTGLTDGQVLTYDSTNGWQNETPASGVTDHLLLSNIGTNTHAQIDTHIADSTLHFTKGSILLDDLGDVVETTITSGDLLRWNGVNWVNYPDSNFATSAQANATHTGEVTGATALTVQVSSITNRTAITEAETTDELPLHDQTDGSLKKTPVNLLTDGGNF